MAKLHHPTYTNMYWDTDLNKLCRSYVKAQPRIMLPFGKIVYYNKEVLNYLRMVYECANQCIVAEASVFKSSVARVDTLPEHITVITKAEWAKKRHAAGEMKAYMEKLSKFMKENGAAFRNKAVVNTNTGKEYPSAQQASLTLGYKEGAVSHSIRYGYPLNGNVFMYKDPEKQAAVEANRANIKPIAFFKNKKNRGV